MNARKQLLLVDDDAATLLIYGEFLRAEGYEVWEAATGQEGLQTARERRPDLVLLDVTLPDLSGVEVCRQIKADPALLDTFVVLFTGHATSAAHTVAGLETGADEYLVKSILPDEFRARIRAIVRLRDAAAALRASEQRHRRLVELLPDAIGLLDACGRLTAVNPPAVMMFGYAHAGELPHKSIFELTPPEEHDRIRADIAAALETGQVRNSHYTLTRHKGDHVLIELSASVSAGSNGQPRGLVVIARDITERSRLEAELLEISAAERRRIGHELHDGLGQYLAGVAFRAKALEQKLACEASPHHKEAKELTTLISNAITQTRNLARGLDPIEVEKVGLLASLQNLVTETEDFFSITCLFRCLQPDLRVDSEPALAFYRIAQEAIHNAITHGAARRIEIEVAVAGGPLCLRIRDDGRGFQVQHAKRTGMGLRVMEYRARSIGAKLVVDSQPNHGTEVRCELPRSAGWGDARELPGRPGLVRPSPTIQ